MQLAPVSEIREVWGALSRVRVEGEAWECGVYCGETSIHLVRVAAQQRRVLRLFDTFCGRPEKGPHDTGGSQTAFRDTSLKRVQQTVGNYPIYHAGRIPQTFQGLEDTRIAFAYLDMDLYQSTFDALAFIVPRLVPGGVILVDDYDAPVQWPGVRLAVDAFNLQGEAHGRRVLLRH